MDFRKPLLYCLNFTNYFVKTLLPPLQALADYHRASHMREGRTHCHNLQVKEISCANPAGYKLNWSSSGFDF